MVLLDEIEKAHPDVFKKFLTAWNDGHVTEASTGAQISTTRAIFMLTSNIATEALGEIADRYADDPERMRSASVEALRLAGFAPEVLNRLDRIFVFRALAGLDIARVAALEIEAMIGSYGLEIATGGIDPALLLEVMQKQDRLGEGASARDLVRSIEEMVSDGLIEARQKGARCVRLDKGEAGIVTRIADLRAHAAGPAGGRGRGAARRPAALSRHVGGRTAVAAGAGLAPAPLAAAIAFTRAGRHVPAAAAALAARPSAARAGAPPAAAPTSRPRAARTPAAHFVPLPAPPPSEYGIVAFPPLGPGRAGIIPFAGRKLPLPSRHLAGTRAGAQRRGGGRAGDGPGPDRGGASDRPAAGRRPPVRWAATRRRWPDSPPASCRMRSRIRSSRRRPAESPMARECWTLTAFDTAGAASGPQPDEVMRGGFDRLGANGRRGAEPHAGAALLPHRRDRLADRPAAAAGPARRPAGGEPAAADLDQAVRRRRCTRASTARSPPPS